MGLFFKAKKFSEPPDKGVFTTVHVMKDKSPIVWVAHELDGDRRFMGYQAIEDYTRTAMVVRLAEIIKLDRSVLKIADLPLE